MSVSSWINNGKRPLFVHSLRPRALQPEAAPRQRESKEAEEAAAEEEEDTTACLSEAEPSSGHRQRANTAAIPRCVHDLRRTLELSPQPHTETLNFSRAGEAARNVGVVAASCTADLLYIRGVYDK
ncbi:hypothetical protein WMY93_034321 [Mugilogobius chulae]|uniref:Uncharacterized protein n=1 Tax=Mugilogobius chulae TaxID=88201 RepID=A0AAW0MJU4_9GOBI